MLSEKTANWRSGVSCLVCTKLEDLDFGFSKGDDHMATCI